MADPNLELRDDPAHILNESAFGQAPTIQGSPDLPPAIQGRPGESLPAAGVSTKQLSMKQHLMDPPDLLAPPRSEVAQPTVKKPPNPAEIMGAAIRNKPAKTQPETIPQRRDHPKWGEPSDQPPPPLHQVPNVFHAIGGWFGNTNLGGAVDQLLGGHLREQSDRYVHEFMWGKNAAADFHHKQMMYASQELATRWKDILIEAKDIMSGDPKDIPARMHALARKYGETTLEYKLNNGSTKDAVTYLEQMDKYWQSLNLSNVQVEKQTQIDQNQAPAYEPPDSPNLVPPKPPGKPDAADSTSDSGGDAFAPHSLTGEPIIVAPGSQAAPGAAQPPAPPAPVPETAPAGPAPYEIPGESSTPDESRAAPASGSPGAADMAALQPDQGIQVAEAGMSDVAPSWAKEMPNLAMAQTTTPPAGEPQPDDWTDWAAPPSHLMDPDQARTASGRVLRNRDYIRNYALQGIDDPASLDRLAKTQPDVANKANQMANEIRANLREIASSNRRPGPGMIRAINSQVPGLGDEVKRVADGNEPPPGAAQLYGQRSPRARMLSSLVGKYDPTMLNPIAYANRAKARQYWSIGKGGDMMLAQGAAYLHGFALLDSLESLRGTGRYGREFSQYDPPIGGDWLRQHGLYPSVQEGKAVSNVIANARVFMNEAEAVLHKGAPTVAGVKTQEEEFDVTRMNVDVLRQHVQTYIDRLRDKMGENIMRFHAGTAQGPDQLDRLFREYVSQGQTPRAVNGRAVSDAIHKMIVGDPGRPDTAPRAEAPNLSIDDVMKRYGQ